MKQSFAAIILAASLTSECHAWWGRGHLITARRAYDILQQENPAALAAAEAELMPLAGSYPYLTNDEGYHPFVECATFADSIKGKGYSWQSGWHFLNQPYFNEGGSLNDYDFVAPKYIVSDAITDLTAWLKKDGSQNNYYQSKINQSFSQEDDARSFALRLIIHYVGDVHQPLHTAAEVNSKFPKGDRGGNSQYLPNKDSAGNLHAVWDSVVYQYAGYPDLPLSQNDWYELGDTTADLNSQVYIPEYDYHQADADFWAEESYASAVNYVYTGFTYNKPLSDEYLGKANYESISRLMYGGRRLADLISYIYDDSIPSITQ